MKNNFLPLLESQWQNKCSSKEQEFDSHIIYFFARITYLRNKIKKIRKLRQTYQFINSKTGIDKLLENNNNIIYTTLLVYQVFSAH